MIPADDPVRLLSACVEGVDLSELYATYGRIRKNQVTPKQLLKIIVYANMNRLYSSRDIEKACRQNINYMYLLDGKPAPITRQSHGSIPFIFPNVQKRSWRR